jgi:hypothetical protein
LVLKNDRISAKYLTEVKRMKWEDVCLAFPKTWVLLEVIQAYTNDDSVRVLKEVAPLQKFLNSPDAMKAYKKFHKEDPSRELYVLHTSRKELNIIEKTWVGVRRS